MNQIIAVILLVLFLGYMYFFRIPENFSLPKTKFIASDGTTAVYDGGDTIKVTNKDGTITVFTIPAGTETGTSDVGIYQATNGDSAIIFKTNDGNSAISVRKSGVTMPVLYTPVAAESSAGEPSSTESSAPKNTPPIYVRTNFGHKHAVNQTPTVYTNGNSTATVVKTADSNTIVVNDNGTTTVYYLEGQDGHYKHYGQTGGSAKLTLNGVQTTNADGTVKNFVSDGQNASVDAPTHLLSQNKTGFGISQDQIPAGQEDMYILKTQIVPMPTEEQLNSYVQGRMYDVPQKTAAESDPMARAMRASRAYGTNTIMNDID